MWKWAIAIVLVLLGACAGTGWYVHTSGKGKEWMEYFRPDLKPTEVKLGKVTTGDLVRAVSAPGAVEPKTKVEISAQVSARIIALPFDENDVVKAGDVVVRLDARDLAALLESAKAQLRAEQARLEGAKAAFANSQSELNRKRQLLESKDIAAAEFDAAELEFRRASSTLRQTEHAIEIASANIQRAEKDLDNTVITAPFDGIITARNAEVGETVVVGTLNNPGSVIMEIADLSVMLVKARVDEANIAPIKEGQKSRIFVNAYKEITLAGTVDHVGLKREVDKDGTAFFNTEVLIELPEGLLLRSGLTANVDVEVETFRDIIKVPSQAIVDRAIDDLPPAVTDGASHLDRTKKFTQVVFTVEGGKVHAHIVKTGVSDLTDTVVLAGLPKDASIVVGPFKSLQNMKDGQVVVEQVGKKPGANGVAEASASSGGASGS